MNKTKLPSTIKAEKKLKVLKELIEMLIDEDVPPEAIKQTTDTIIQKVKTKKKLSAYEIILSYDKDNYLEIQNIFDIIQKF